MQMQILREVRKIESERIDIIVPDSFKNREVEILIIPVGPPEPPVKKQDPPIPAAIVTPHTPEPSKPVNEPAKSVEPVLPHEPGEVVPLDIPGIGTVNIAMEKNGLLGIRGTARYYVKGVGNIDLKIRGNVLSKIYFEGTKGDVYVRISNRGDVKLKYRDATLEVDNDFGVGVFAGKVMAKASCDTSGSVKINGVEVGVGGGGSINAEIDENGGIRLSGGVNTEICLGKHQLRFKANSHITLNENGVIRELRNVLVKLHDGTYKKLSGTLKKVMDSGHKLLECAKTSFNKTLHPGSEHLG